MTGIKRLLAGFLAGLILFSCAAASGEDGIRDTVEIQESLVSREDDTDATLEDHLLLMWNLMQEKEVRNLLQIEDVQVITSEVLAKVLIWMIRNRPVTMKILTEFGVAEEDRRCIGTIWDSAERIQAAINQYLETEDGKSLADEFTVLKDDPEFREALEQFMAMLSSDEVRSLIASLTEPETSGTKAAHGAGPLEQIALDRALDENSFLGSLILKLLNILDQNGWASETLPALLQNENLWRFLLHLAGSSTELNSLINEEYEKLTSDPDVMAFAERTLSALAAVSERVRSLGSPVPDPEESTDEAAKEAAP